MKIKNLSFFLTVVFFLFHAQPVFAVLQIFIQEYTCEAGEMDGRVSARAIALEHVKGLLLDELATCMEREPVAKDYQLSQDKITLLAAGIVQTTILEEKWDGQTYRIKAKMVADPDAVAVSIDQLRNSGPMAEDLAQVRQEAKGALEEVELLNEEPDPATADREKKQKQYEEAVNQLIAADWFEKGHAFNMAGQYQQAARAYEKVIQLKPDGAKAYASRGFVYLRLGEYQQALRDLDQAVVLNPKNSGYDDYRKIAHKMQNDPDQLSPRERTLLERPEKGRLRKLNGEQDGERPTLKSEEGLIKEDRTEERQRKIKRPEQLKGKKKIKKKEKASTQA